MSERKELLSKIGRCRAQLSSLCTDLRDYGANKAEARLVFNLIETLQRARADDLRKKGSRVMKPEDKPWNREEFVARQLAIVAKYTKVQLKPKPTPQQKAREAWKPSLEAMAKANGQSNRLLFERTEAEMEEAQRLRQREQFIQTARIANERAVELGYYQRRMEALAERRYDPATGAHQTTVAARTIEGSNVGA